jgi:hypothetical protein
MSDYRVAAWGAFGGLTAYLLVFVIPAVSRVLEAQKVTKTTTGKAMIAFAVLLVSFLILGAASAIYVGASNVRGALTAGASGEALLKGVTSGARSLNSLGESLRARIWHS